MIRIMRSNTKEKTKGLPLPKRYFVPLYRGCPQMHVVDVPKCMSRGSYRLPYYSRVIHRNGRSLAIMAGEEDEGFEVKEIVLGGME